MGIGIKKRDHEKKQNLGKRNPNIQFYLLHARDTCSIVKKAGYLRRIRSKRKARRFKTYTQ